MHKEASIIELTSSTIILCVPQTLEIDEEEGEEALVAEEDLEVEEVEAEVLEEVDSNKLEEVKAGLGLKLSNPLETNLRTFLED